MIGYKVPKYAARTKMIGVHVTPRMHKAMVKDAKEQGRSVSDVVHEMLVTYLSCSDKS